MWLDSLRRLVKGNQRKRASRGYAARTRRRRPTVLALETLEDRMVLSTLTVNTLSDSANFKVGDGSLRGEIAAAQIGDTIQFGSGLVGQINLTAGELKINESLTIVGSTTTAGAPDITINADGASRVFAIEGGNTVVNVTLQNLTVTGGAANRGAGLFIRDTAGTVTLNNLDITSNHAVGAAGANAGYPGTNTPAPTGGAGQNALGGGIYFAGGGSAGTLVITNSTLQSNGANGGTGGQGGFGGLDTSGTGSGTGVGGMGGTGGYGEGGGLYVTLGSLQLTNDTIANNSALGGQGGQGGAGGVNGSNQNAMGGAGGVGGHGEGGGLYVVNASVQISGGTIQGNTAHGGNGGPGGAGGHVEPSAPGTVVFNGSGGNAEGGGVFVSNGSLQVSTATIQNNAATGGSNPMSNGAAANNVGGSALGGGLYTLGGSLFISNSTLNGNVAKGGAAKLTPGSASGGAVNIIGGNAQLFNDTLTLNSTRSGSATSSGSGGATSGGAAVALFAVPFTGASDLRLINDTIAKNSALSGRAANGVPFGAYGGAIYNVGMDGTLSTIEMTNTILALNTAQNSAGIDQEISGPINSSSHDLIDNDAVLSYGFTPGPGDLIGVTPNFAPLGNYGGPTQTMPLLPGSPGIDAGTNSLQGPATIPGLVDWWRGDGNANDSAGPNFGISYGNIGSTQGVSGQAFSFPGQVNGQGSYLDFGTGADIVGTGAFTISAWIRTTSDGMIINQRDSNNFNGEYVLSVLNGKINWYTFGNNQYGFNITSSKSVNDGNWHLITVTRLADGTGQIFIDGQNDGSSPGTAVPLLSGVHVYLGEDVRNAVDLGSSQANNFVGQIDEVQIYNQALSASQIQSLTTLPYTPTGPGAAEEWPTMFNGLASWLPGDGNFADASGNGIPGTPTGGVSFTQGQVGQAFQFDGSSGRINIARSQLLNPFTFTVGGWFQVTQAPAAGTTAYLASQYDGKGHGWILSVNSNLIPELSLLSSLTNNISVSSSTPLALNQWYYIAATNTSSTPTLYVNGKAVGSTTQPGPYFPSTSSTPLTIGAASYANSNYFAGKVDEFAYYNRALSPAEISALSVPLTDQRGGVRTVGPSIDMGAIEYQYDLAVTGNAPADVLPGNPITYNLIVTNNGPDAVPNVTLTDTLPVGVTYQSLNTPGGWTLGTQFVQTFTATNTAGLAPGASATFTLTATVNSTTPSGTVLTNTVSVSPSTDDSNLANDRLSLTTTAGIPQPSDPGFELPHLSSGAFAYNPSGSPWTFASSSGVAGNGSAFTSSNPNAPQGTQVAFLQQKGTISQAVSFMPGTYTISFEAAQRGSGNNGGQTFAVQIDGATVGTFTPSGTSYAVYTTNAFTVPAGSHTISFVGLDPNGLDNTAFLDAVTISTAVVPQVGDAGFETSNVGSGFQYNPSGTPWTFASTSGVTGNNSAFTSGNPPAPQGTQVGFIQNTGTISQAVNFAVGTCTISFEAAQRGNGNNGGQTFAVQIDGTTVGTFTPTGSSYTAYTINTFIATTGPHTLAFVGLDPNGQDNTAFIDQVSIQAAPTGVDIHGQPHDALAGRPIGPVTVAVVDANGNTIPNSSLPVTLSIYSGPTGAVLEGATTVRAVNGMATFTNLALSEAGAYVLAATSGKLDPDYSNPIVISPADVSDDVRIEAQKLQPEPGRPYVVEKVTITNTSKETLHGPLALVLSDLSSGVMLLNAGGSYQGNSYVDVLGAMGSLAPGQRVTILLSFLVTGLRDAHDLAYSAKMLLGI